MARPTDWSPLADSDPVPGDPQRISEQAARLASAAQQIQGQVSQLRAIEAGQSEERGLHVDKLKSASADVAGSLEQVVGRYQKTSSALSAWIPELEYAQSQSPERQHPAGHDPRDLRPRPGSGMYLVLAFATNLDPLADGLVDLFDAIARTLQWRT